MTATRFPSVLAALLVLAAGAGSAAAQEARYGPAPNPYAPYGGYGYYGAYGPYPARGYGGALQGAASLTAATGQYNKDIQQASMTREKVRQESLVTQKQRMQAEMDYEDLRKRRYRQEMSNERFLILDHARRFPTDDEIWSGKTLNVLCKSVMMSPSPTSGPTIPLTPTTLRGLNLTATGTNGNLGLAKDGGKIDWSDALMEAPFDAARNRFDSKFEIAMKDIQAGQRPDRAVIADLRSDYKSLCSTLDDRITDLSPDAYNTSRRRLNQVKVALDGLTDRRALRSFNSEWKKDVRNVSELVAYCQSNGLEFGGATASGDRACYEAAYYALRSYERDVVQLASASK